MANRQNIGFQLLSTTLSVAGGVLAGMVSRRIWDRVGPDSPTPVAKDLSRGIGEVLVAAALQGAIFAIVQAAFDRAGAKALTAVADADPI